MAKSDSKQQPPGIETNHNKPKYQQTRLCFTSAASPPTTTTTTENTRSSRSTSEPPDDTVPLSKSIQSLTIGNKRKHTSPLQHAHCKDCKKSVPRVQCTAYKENTTEPCTNTFCMECIQAKTNEDLKQIKNKDKAVTWLYKSGRPVKHRPVLTGYQWACLACRGLCDCEFCTIENAESANKAPKLSFHRKPSSIQPIKPPELKPIVLLYTQEELWVRLQIREFLFRFGDLYKVDYRILANLQNAQGDWKIKRLGAYIVWLFLTTLSSTSSSHYDVPQNSFSSGHPSTQNTAAAAAAAATGEEAITLPQKARKILKDWITEKKLSKYYVDAVSRQQALLEILYLEGMSGKRWQDIAELLALADMSDVPIPTTRQIAKLKQTMDFQLQNDAMDIDDGHEQANQQEDSDEKIKHVERCIERYRTSGRNTSLLSPETELKLICMLLELLLLDSHVRSSLTMTTTTATTKTSSSSTHSKRNQQQQQQQTATLKDLALEFKKYTKEHSVEEMKNKHRRNTLNNRIQQLKMIRGKAEEVKAAQAELDALETLMRDERMTLESKKIEMHVHQAKTRKRLEPAGRDHLGNEYWIFSDIVDHLHQTGDYRNSEPYWAYGVVIIGPGFLTEETGKQQDPSPRQADNEENNKHTQAWWYLKGREDLTLLIHYLKQQSLENGNDSLAETVTKINQRLDYLASLECAVYGDGFFS
ncbi:hypothetical protein BDF20DRAFT_916899 [Mycotypha africana]|uniref:uncharacterized protein n=1 Tax=Mycotypha africana TaxID=64632 RepID=UPI0022FFEFD4|nr:uncharacterized protein BDF20DRAFT_916899 [Mycotypha africana]KAI8968361.1 hypothetical protein BDF20DRAFT_916899 [Mycotypha africana]